jgi:hypothetical protein
MKKPNKDIVIGEYLVIAERNGSGNVYREDDPGDCVFHGDTFKEAVAWVYEILGEPPPDDEDDPEEPPAETKAAPLPGQRAAQKKPCRQCPWRRKSAPGWLGAGSPESFVATLMLDIEPLPCHSTIDYNRPDWHVRWTRGLDKKAKLCAGALIAAANSGKMSRFAARGDVHGDTFASMAEFIEYHRSSPVRSWRDPEPGSLEFEEHNNVRKLVRLPVLTGKP